MSTRMPAIFFGHGNPMNALRDNEWTQAWAAIGANIARPQAIVSVSAHWYAPKSAVTAMQTPRTIHDFGGFPRQLFQYQYPAPGDPLLAKRMWDLLAPLDLGFDESWGLDHGTWSVLCHVFPDADVPVVQLCIDETKPASFRHRYPARARSKSNLVAVASVPGCIPDAGTPRTSCRSSIPRNSDSSGKRAASFRV